MFTQSRSINRQRSDSISQPLFNFYQAEESIFADSAVNRGRTRARDHFPPSMNYAWSGCSITLEHANDMQDDVHRAWLPAFIPARCHYTWRQLPLCINRFYDHRTWLFLQRRISAASISFHSQRQVFANFLSYIFENLSIVFFFSIKFSIFFFSLLNFNTQISGDQRVEIKQLMLFRIIQATVYLSKVQAIRDSKLN